MQKKILLGMPPTYQLDRVIISELESMGYDVVSLNERSPFTFLDRVECFVRERIFKNKTIRKKRFNERIRKLPKNLINEYDVCLIFRADGFSKRILKKLRKMSKKMISYHFDGVELFGPIADKVKFFDDFYVFDKNDINKHPGLNLKHATNFYFKKPILNQYDYDFYYLGYFNEGKIKLMNELSDYFNKNKISYLFNIFFIDFNRDKINEFDNIEPIFKSVPYKEYIERMDRSRHILDIIVIGHSGLSFRIIESMWYKKKVVTNNYTVKEYDFYDPQNIFILDERPLSELKDFLQSEYKEVDPDIVEKYSFEYWFNEKIGKM